MGFKVCGITVGRLILFAELQPCFRRPRPANLASSLKAKSIPPPRSYAALSQSHGLSVLPIRWSLHIGPTQYRGTDEWFVPTRTGQMGEGPGRVFFSATSSRVSPSLLLGWGHEHHHDRKGILVTWNFPRQSINVLLHSGSVRARARGRPWSTVHRPVVRFVAICRPTLFRWVCKGQVIRMSHRPASRSSRLLPILLRVLSAFSPPNICPRKELQLDY